MTNIVQTNISQLQKLTKYILMGLIVIFATKYIPDNNLQIKEISMIGITSAISFAILDMISPSISIYTQPSQEKISTKVIVEAFNNKN